MNAVNATGRPIAPSSRSLRAVWIPAPINVSGAQPTRNFFCLATSRTFRPSSRFTPKGFSAYVCLPASSARSAIGAWALGTVRFSTTSIDGSAISSSTDSTRGTPNSFAFRSAASRTTSAQATISTTGKFFAIPRYAPLIAPHPTTPTLTFSMTVNLKRRLFRRKTAREAYGHGGWDFQRLEWLHLHPALADERLELVRPDGRGLGQLNRAPAPPADEPVAGLWRDRRRGV